MEEAVYREIQEEVGIERKSLKLVGKSDNPLKIELKEIKLKYGDKEYAGSERYFFGFHFLGKDSEIKLQENEVRMYKWVPFLKLRDYLLFDNQLQETLKKILEIFPHLS